MGTGPINISYFTSTCSGKDAKGIPVHIGTAVTAAGRPMGMFSLHADFRRDNEKDSVRWLEGLDRAKELEAACFGTRVVSVCDREGDFQYLLTCAANDGNALSACASRSAKQCARTLDGGKERLQEHVAARPSR